LYYSALLKELKTYPELAALLSHEFTHVNNKHSTRSIFSPNEFPRFFKFVIWEIWQRNVGDG
jgi:Zn-dependent protease with chaperone function